MNAKLRTLAPCQHIKVNLSRRARQTKKKREREIERETERQTDRPTDRQTDRPTDRPTRDRPFVRNWKTCVCVRRWKLGLAWNYHGLCFLQLPRPHPCPHPRASNRRARKQFNSGHLAAHASTASRCQVAVNDQPSLAFIVQPVLFTQVL